MKCDRMIKKIGLWAAASVILFPQLASALTVNVADGDGFSGQQDRSISVNVAEIGSRQITGIDLELSYDGNLIQVLEVVTDPLTSEWEIFYRVSSPGRVHIALSSDNPLPNEPGSMVRIHFGVLGGTQMGSISSLHLVRAEFNEAPADVIHDGSFEIINSSPSLNEIPNQSINEDGSLIHAVDLWSVASDVEAAAGSLTYSIVSMSQPNAGVTLESNRYLNIAPLANWNGTSAVIVRVADPQNATAERSFTVTVNPMNDPPTVVLLSPAGGELWRGVQTISWQASDIDGDNVTVGLEYSNGAAGGVIASGQSAAGSYSWDTRTAPDLNNYILTATVSDGTVVTTNSSQPLTIDNTAPQITLTEPADGSSVATTPITVIGNVDDPQAEIELEINGEVIPAVIETNGVFRVEGVNLNPGANVLRIRARDLAGNTSEITSRVFLGWVLYLDIPYHEKLQPYYSGAAGAQMVLNFQREGVATLLTQEQIYSYGHPRNLLANRELAEMDASAIFSALGHFDPYDPEDPTGSGSPWQGYSYSVNTFDPAADTNAMTNYVKDIVHWLAYPARRGFYYQEGELAARPNTPALIPGYGEYGHWVVINGGAASANPMPDPYGNPWETSLVEVYGLWLTDSAQDGMGRDLYVTASEAAQTYLRPLASQDRYNGKYLQIGEPPPEESRIEVAIGGGQSGEMNEKLMRVMGWLEAKSGLERHLADSVRGVNLKEGNEMILDEETELKVLFKNGDSPQKAGTVPIFDWGKVIDGALLTREEFRQAFDQTILREPLKVYRPDTGESYYLLLFDRYLKGRFKTQAAVVVDAQNGIFRLASWLNQPKRLAILSESAAKELVAQETGIAPDQMQGELIWQAGEFSTAPFYPYWRIMSPEGGVWHVTPDSEVRPQA